MENEVVIASSEIDAGISCWDLQSGAENLRYRNCSSPVHGLITVGSRFLASSQLRESSSSSGSILYWSWNKPQVDAKSFPAEPINPLVSNSEGTYIIGGGVKGDIYLWEVLTGRLLKKWHAHYRAVTCLVYSDDESLLISGAEDGAIRVWSLLMMFDDEQLKKAKHPYEYSFSEHTLRVTDIVTGYGGCNAIIISASEDRTCKVWSLSKGKLLRNIVFPSVINAIAIDPGEHIFYAAARDGKIYIASLNSQCSSTGNYGMHIIGTLSDHSKAVSCLAFSLDGYQLVAGSEDGMVRVWNTKTQNIVRVFKHAKGPVNNILVIRQPSSLYPRTSSNSQVSSGRRHGSLLPPPLEKFIDSGENFSEGKTFVIPQDNPDRPLDFPYVTVATLDKQIAELQKKSSSAAAEMEIQRLRAENQKSMEMIQQWRKMYANLNQFCVNELLLNDANGPSA
jgi:pre-rRNA-processing protein IPI3